jgi:hypothetical protein
MKLITDVLREYRRGSPVDQASRLLAEVVRAVDETGKAGEVTIKVKVIPDKDGGSGKELAVEVKCKRPERDLPKAVFFSDPNGDLHRTDPAQSEMFSEAGGREPRSSAPHGSPEMRVAAG